MAREKIMKKDNGKPEILAPVGSWQCFWAALDNGADSFYAGLKSLNARDLAPNFNIDEMYSLVETAHKYKKKVYVTLNSLVKESEIKDLVHILCALNYIKPDGLIIQDLSVLYLCKRFFPDLELHASTLMGFHNSVGVSSARELGFKRVVLARELTLEEIKACCQVKDIEIELFVAGALCFSISGLCLMSSFLGGKSSMRGKCVQPCRRRYSIKNRFGYFFSMKDLCLLDFVPEFIDMGVKAFKIEGRLRPAHYVASMVKAFKMVIDDFSNLDEAKKIASNACGRPHTTAYIKNPHPDDAIDPLIAPNTGLYAGKIVDILGDNILVDTKLEFEVGDKIRLVDKREEFQQSFDVVKVDHDPSGYVILSFNTNAKVSKDVNKLLKRGILVFKSSTVYKKKEKRQIKIHKRLNTSYITRDKKEILDFLKDRSKPLKITKQKRQKQIILKITDTRYISRLFSLLHTNKLDPPDIIYVELKDNLKSNIKMFNDLKKRGMIYSTVWALPVFIPEAEIRNFQNSLKWLFKKGCRRFAISNLGQLSLLKSISQKTIIYAGYQINIANSLSVNLLRSLGITDMEFSVESDRENFSMALKNSPGSVRVHNYAFGLIPLFTSRMKHLKDVGYYPIISPKKEKFFLFQDKFLEYILPENPINLLADIKNNNLVQGLIFDFRFQHPLLRDKLKGRRVLISKIKGYKFNWHKNWH